MPLKRLGLACALAGVLLSAAAQAQTFTILSQNMLRFGHGSRLATQCAAITAMAAAVDVIVLQEVMKSGYPCLAANNNKGVNVPIPPNFAYATSGPKGRTSYIEYYGILYRTNVRNNQQITYLGQNDALSTTLTFMRPPYGVRLQVTDTVTHVSCNVWIVDIHSIFGPTVAGRQAEAAAMLGVYNNLMALANGSVIVAGDWNVPANDALAFGWVAGNNAVIQPNVLTSLTATGAPSSAYDHAINTSNALVAPSVVITPPPAGWTSMGGLAPGVWRTTVSDHMSVIGNVALTC